MRSDHNQSTITNPATTAELPFDQAPERGSILIVPVEVASSRQWTETKVYGSTTNGNGVVTSSTIHHSEAWFRFPDGSESMYRLDNWNQSVYTGQRIKLVGLKNRQTGTFHPFGLLNEASGDRPASTTSMRRAIQESGVVKPWLARGVLAVGLASQIFLDWPLQHQMGQGLVVLAHNVSDGFSQTIGDGFGQLFCAIIQGALQLIPIWLQIALFFCVRRAVYHLRAWKLRWQLRSLNSRHGSNQGDAVRPAASTSILAS